MSTKPDNTGFNGQKELFILSEVEIFTYPSAGFTPYWETVGAAPYWTAISVFTTKQDAIDRIKQKQEEIRNNYIEWKYEEGMTDEEKRAITFEEANKDDDGRARYHFTIHKTTGPNQVGEDISYELK